MAVLCDCWRENRCYLLLLPAADKVDDDSIVNFI